MNKDDSSPDSKEDFAIDQEGDNSVTEDDPSSLFSRKTISFCNIR